MKVTLVIEKKSKTEIFGWVQQDGIIPYCATVGKSMNEVEFNIRDLFQDYKETDGKEVKEWKKIDPQKDVEFEYLYSMVEFFGAFPVLKMSDIAIRAGLNLGLVRQYASGVKNPSKEQVKKIEAAVHGLGNQLLRVSLS